MIKKKFYLMIFLFVFLVVPIFAIRITEVELNPEDDCRDCTEWAELYSEVEINLSEYHLENSKSNIINLEGIKKGYIKIDFGKRFLTNTGDTLILKKSEQIIDETPLLKDEENNDLTWQLCEIWEFKESTKGEKNVCEENSEEQKEPNEVEQDILGDGAIQENHEDNDFSNNQIEELSDSYKTPIKPKDKEQEVIKLNTQNIKSEEDKENLNKNNYAIYGFVIFCVLISFLFILKKNWFNKNEFR